MPRGKAAPAVLEEQALEAMALEAFANIEDSQFNGAVETYIRAVAAMLRCPKNLKVQRAGCFAMSYGSVTKSRFVFRAGGLEAVVAAMGLHPLDDRLQGDALEALRLLAEAAGGVARVLAAGGLQAGIAAMAVLPEAPVVQQEGLGFLRSMAVREAKEVLCCGGLEAVMRVMDLFRQYTWVQLWAVQAMCNMADVDARRVAGANGFEAAANAMKKHPDCQVLQQVCQELLKKRPPG